MYATALVAIDFSPAARQLLKRLARLRRFGTRKIVLLHVQAKGDDVEETMERLEAKAAKLGPEFEVECVVKQGKAAQEILTLVDARNIPLIVLAARSHSLAHRLVLGSVADEVVHWTSRAVLLEDVTEGRDGTNAQGPVLIATDGSRASSAAETLALEIGREGGVSVVSVVDGDGLERGWQITAKILGDAEKLGIKARRSVETGRPGEVIARVAAQSGASLIVVGRRATAQRGLGSTAQTICERANRPVLLVPAV